ncbi:hypothetical protein WT21_10170 [Burkholderia territorii]|nr:hypothetical protein WT21_10170 [Burkholderia territorii]KWH03834.1 hypothetical protein WT58_24785 [Burkholderia territorii]
MLDNERLQFFVSGTKPSQFFVQRLHILDRLIALLEHATNLRNLAVQPKRNFHVSLEMFLVVSIGAIIRVHQSDDRL